MLLAGLTSGFHDLVRADDSIPPNVQDQIVDGSQDGVPMISEAQAESIAKKGGLSADQTKNVVDHYSDAQIEALKKAILAAAAFSLVALWFAGDLPGAPLASTGIRGCRPEGRRRGYGGRSRVSRRSPRIGVTIEIILLALASTVRPTSLAAVDALLSTGAPRRLMIVYTAAGLTFTIAVGLLIIGAFQGVDINSGTDRTKGIAEIASGIVALASRWAC